MTWFWKHIRIIKIVSYALSGLLVGFRLWIKDKENEGFLVKAVNKLTETLDRKIS